MDVVKFLKKKAKELENNLIENINPYDGLFIRQQHYQLIIHQRILQMIPQETLQLIFS